MDHCIHLSMFVIFTYMVTNSVEATRYHVSVSLLEHNCGDKKVNCDISMNLEKGKALNCLSDGKYDCCQSCNATRVMHIDTSPQEDTVLVRILVCRHSDFFSDPNPNQMCHLIHLNPTKNSSTEITYYTTSARIGWSVDPYTDNTTPTSTVVSGISRSSTHLLTTTVSNAPSTSAGTTNSLGTTYSKKTAISNGRSTSAGTTISSGKISTISASNATTDTGKSNATQSSGNNTASATTIERIVININYTALSSSAISVPAIVGIACGLFVALVLTIVVAVLVRRHCKHKNAIHPGLGTEEGNTAVSTVTERQNPEVNNQTNENECNVHTENENRQKNSNSKNKRTQKMQVHSDQLNNNNTEPQSSSNAYDGYTNGNNEHVNITAIKTSASATKDEFVQNEKSKPKNRKKNKNKNKDKKQGHSDQDNDQNRKNQYSHERKELKFEESNIVQQGSSGAYPYERQEAMDKDDVVQNGKSKHKKKKNKKHKKNNGLLEQEQYSQERNEPTLENSNTEQQSGSSAYGRHMQRNSGTLKDETDDTYMPTANNDEVVQSGKSKRKNKKNKKHKKNKDGFLEKEHNDENREYQYSQEGNEPKFENNGEQQSGSSTNERQMQRETGTLKDETVDTYLPTTNDEVAQNEKSRHKKKKNKKHKKNKEVLFETEQSYPYTDQNRDYQYSQERNEPTLENSNTEQQSGSSAYERHMQRNSGTLKEETVDTYMSTTNDEVAQNGKSKHKKKKKHKKNKDGLLEKEHSDPYTDQNYEYHYSPAFEGSKTEQQSRAYERQMHRNTGTLKDETVDTYMPTPNDEVAQNVKSKHKKKKNKKHKKNKDGLLEKENIDQNREYSPDSLVTQLNLF